MNIWQYWQTMPWIIIAGSIPLWVYALIGIIRRKRKAAAH